MWPNSSIWPFGYRSPVLEMLLAGGLAGYAIAIPVGPITILIFDMALRRGLRTGAAGAAGAASADGIYATTAGVFGAALSSLLTPVLAPARLIGAATLAFIGLRGLLRASRHGSSRADVGQHLGGSGALRTYLLFLALTITNPMTFVYFAALMLGLPSLADSGAAEKIAFAGGAFAASLSWQIFLASTGALLSGRLPVPAITATRVIGSLVVIGFAVRIALEAIGS